MADEKPVEQLKLLSIFAETENGGRLEFAPKQIQWFFRGAKVDPKAITVGYLAPEPPKKRKRGKATQESLNSEPTETETAQAE